MHSSLIVVLVSLSVVACSSSSSGPDAPTDTGASIDSGSGVVDSGVDTAGSDTTLTPDVAAETAAAKPATPEIVMVMKMAGALHVSWKLNDTKLDSVLVFRKKDAGAYAKAYTLAGTATSQHDMDANLAGATYCYQVQTSRGGVTSELSVEMCGSP